ncbi:gamma-glutamyl-gamma-aminobutyrate hydrolase family protein [Trinickia dinghuensis]|uniref:gamma-glutamyl-gamma-aminobutyrate hydrolase n=1 Tax=Trinickia dinghuensis TaxID=2291023 RepID=A0A3D8K127_9BURK|nr:gamma-glutamyl-gamma-aminobutyrate hydrolase family protein [Trinickia dinghuensis]RDU99157.1 gamma-glutamyl-gamma-aminobutyrate hydrolase family protein [Trinickia dinghuensis]
MLNKPLVGVTADSTEIGMHRAHVVVDKYITAVVEGAGALAVAIPALGEKQPIPALLQSLDGLVFTGSASNVEPRRYGGAPSAPGTLHDPARDATTLPLMRAAIESGVPVLAICRGFQEMNVVYGGTLHQRVHELDGHDDHRENQTDPLDVQYGPAHTVRLSDGGLLRTLAGNCTEARVNSLHAQGIAKLAPGLTVEALAPDGLIEAVRVTDAVAFALGVQWHPEWQHASDPFSTAIFRAFGAACRARMSVRLCAQSGAHP